MDDKKKRLLVLVLVAVLAIAVTLLLTETKEPAQQPLQPASKVAQPNSPNTAGKFTSPTLPNGASATGQMMRDIFSPPAEYAAVIADSNRVASPGGVTFAGGGAPAGGQQTLSAGATPRLTGVIAGQDSRVVILRQGTISRSYRVGEAAGSYRVTAIGNNTVTLEGPTGTIVLTMGK